ncbi:TRAPP II complex, TRAPPC10 [Penicillium italicum]|uniref:TRAPP II complex, TRAPPC10 n=1 Tax=Penicillium italicum TaxID=40296 RepID=A0A0A2KY46_PENIT|nr:TRAPP II complex, TRAPPC10 [Penicillium italicum]
MNTPPRGHFLVRQAAIVVWQYLALDVFATLALQQALEQEKSGMLPPVPQWDISTEQWIERIISNIMAGFVVSRILIDFHHRVFSMILVGLGLDSPANCPPLYGRALDADTVRGFWGKFWHQLLQNPLTSVSAFITQVLLGLRPRSFVQRYMNVFVVFFCSGGLHLALDVVQGIPAQESGAMLFFVTAPLGLVIEDAVKALWKYFSKSNRPGKGIPKPLWQRALGLTWSMAWLGVTSTGFFYPQVLRPQNQALVPFSVAGRIGLPIQAGVVLVGGAVLAKVFEVESIGYFPYCAREIMDPSQASSNVTVEYTDPSGLFPLIQPVIESKLPLKNLHWKSPTRPVRSIESLRIGFTPAQEQNERKLSSDTVHGTVAHRRHQIPGLRQTPYLKVYLLRCDDNETYKATARRNLREWIKTNASSQTSQSVTTSQEKHDAFEWLILHVVPDVDAADRAATPASKWGRGSTTVLEKAKADFNGSSKSAVDRVAQLRLPKQATKSPELAEQLEDLIDKMKNGILASFDLRVAQYEDDIKEKDSQRSLPGWNFCTFFILKEGLARGFENVGLFEDALAGYDELAVGLDAAIREQLDGSGDQHSGALSITSKNWAEMAKKALKTGASDDSDGNDGDAALFSELQPEDFPFDANKMHYREMILGSDISIFDFRTYIFSRQLTLLLRAARAPSLAGSETAADSNAARSGKKPENLILLAEICGRATEFIGLAARTLRYDLECGLAEVVHDDKTDVINNLVSSWAFSAAFQILSQTSTPTLMLPESSLHAVAQSSEASAVTMADSRADVPRRSSSLIASSGARPPRPVTQDISDSVGLMQRRSTMEHPKPIPIPTQKTGSEQLSSGRAELLLLARRSLEEIASRRGWAENWNNLGLLFDDHHRSGASDLAEISLDDDDTEESQTPSKKTESSLVGIDLSGLRAALKSKDAFLFLYEDLTDRLICHHMAANRVNSVEQALAEIAILRYRQKDYESAASYFHRMALFYGSKCWIALEGSMLELHARCLKELKRNEDYVRMMIRLLSKFATYAQAQLSVKQKSVTGSIPSTEQEMLERHVRDLFETAGALQKDVSVSLTDFFADFRVDPAIRLYDDKDGFQIQLSLRFLLGQQIDIDTVKIRLVSANTAQNSEHWVESSAKFVVKASSTQILIDSSTTLQGKYFIGRLEMRAGNLVFNFHGGHDSTLPVGFRETEDSEETDNQPYIYCYPPVDALQAKIVSPHLINLQAMRTLELELDSGRNDIKSGTIRVRPGTAGLRLRLAETEVVDGKIEVDANHESGVIEFAHLPARSFVRLRIPYTVEEAFSTLSARAEIGYETEQGRFATSASFNVVSTLPISVNVQDIFKDELLFSRFTISPAMLIPLRIMNCSLPSSDIYNVQPGITGPVALDVFPKQPASLLYKIRHTEDNPAASTPRSLQLSVDFTCVDDECLDAIEKQFAASINSSPFRQYAALLTSHIVSTFRAQLSTNDMEAIGLIREVNMLPYQTVRWDDLLGALKVPGEDVRQWLQDWHKVRVYTGVSSQLFYSPVKQNNSTVPLPAQPTIPARRIIIPVDVPEIQVVHTADLQLQPKPTTDPGPSTHAAVGQMIAAELSLRHTRRWCSPATREDANQPLECSYEVHANSDQWQIGGRRRGNFLARDGETTRFTVLLLPQKPGHLLLPSIEIRTFLPPAPQLPTSPPAADATGSMAPARRSIPCEVDYRNHGETVLVLPDLKKTTVNLSAAGGNHAAGGGSWLVDSERRTEQVR